MNTGLFQDLCRHAGDLQPLVLCVGGAPLATEREKDIRPNLSILSGNSDASMGSQSLLRLVSVCPPRYEIEGLLCR